MKKLIIFIAISFITTAQINLGFGINSFHLDTGPNAKDYNFNNDNRIITLEYQQDKELYGVVHFTNSFGNESFGAYKGIVQDKNNKAWYSVYRVGIIKGYNRVDTLPSLTNKNKVWLFDNYTVFYKDYSLLLTYGFGYQFNKQISLEVNIIGNCITTGLKGSF